MSEPTKILASAPSARDQRLLDAVGPDYFGSAEHTRDLQDAHALYPEQDLPGYYRRMGYCVGAAAARKRERMQAVLDARERRDGRG